LVSVVGIAVAARALSVREMALLRKSLKSLEQTRAT
jgi:hypothetical protein